MKRYTTNELYGIYRRHPKVVIDSRQVAPGCLFAALRGTHYDGHEFAEEALQAGAAFALIDNPVFHRGDRYLLVEHTVLDALQALARHHRMHFAIPVLGITGSNGKTTTKELCQAVLRRRWRTHATPGNWNNHIGLPLTLLAMPSDTQVAVIEMGASSPGEIAMLCEIARPTHGLVTNVGAAHLEGFGSLEGVMRTKKELYDFLATHGGTALVNLNEPHLARMAAAVSKRLYYGDECSGCMPCLQGQMERDFPEVRFSVRLFDGTSMSAESRLAGRHNYQNLLTATAVGALFGVEAEQMAAAIACYVPRNKRSEVRQAGPFRILLDAYNANPVSMRHALDTFAHWPQRPRIAVLGHMLELGAMSNQAHDELAAYALAQGFDHVLLVGEAFQAAARRHGLPWFATAVEVAKWFAERSWPKETALLLKGSRGIALEQMLEQLPFREP